MKNKINNKQVVYKQKKFHWKTIKLIILISILLFSKSSYSTLNVMNKDTKYYLEMYGVVLLNNNIENEKKKLIDSVEVEILSLDKKFLGSTISNEKGQCYFRLPLNEQYILKVSKKGLVTKLINVDTRINKEDFKKYNLPFEIEMYEEIKELEILLLKEPIAAIKYNLFINDFDYNQKLPRISWAFSM